MARDANLLLSTEKGLPLVQKVGDFRLAVCFPGDYAWGMANLGYQSLLRLVFEAPYWRGERFFSASGPFSVETGVSLASFDVLAFSLSFELDVFRLVTFLQEGRIPLFTHQRDENDPWVIVGGPLVTLNPEIVAPFVDFAFIGEGEEIFPQILALWREGKRNGMPRLEMKKTLSSLPGVYVPEGVIPIYRDGDLVGFEKQEGFFFPVLRQVTNLELFETRTFIYAPSAYFRETALIEVNRGCAYRCRFCAGRYLYSPLRQRSFQLVQRMLENVSGWTDRIGLVGSDVLSYPELEELLRYLMVHQKELTCSSLSGLRLRENQSLLTLLRRGGLRTLTIAPESGSCRLRRFLGKGLQNEEWKELVEQAVKVGFDRIKLYFILGKPGGGVEEDLEFLQKIMVTVPSTRMAVSYSFLVPKPHTLLQDLVPPSLAVWKREKEMFERGLRKFGVEVSGESPRFAFLELLLSRGDRLLAEKIPEVLHRGGNFAAWRRALQELKRDPEEWPRFPWRGEVRPWSMVLN